MTARELEIIKAALDVAHDAEGALLGEPTLHAAVNERLQARGKVAATLGEFTAARDTVGTRGFLTRIENRITGKPKWAINEAGEAARLEM